MGKDLLIIGAGGHGRNVAGVMEDMANEWNLLGYLDDDPLKQGKEINGIPVLGKVDDVGKYPDCYFITILGTPLNWFIKKRLVEHLKIGIDRYATIIHPEARVSKNSTIGRDTVIMPGANIMANAEIGNHVSIKSNTYVGHDTQIGDYVGIANSTSIAGRVRIEEGVYIGANSSIKEDLTIGQWSLVGIGAVVVKNIPPYEIWAGNPARFLSKRK